MSLGHLCEIAVPVIILAYGFLSTKHIYHDRTRRQRALDRQRKEQGLPYNFHEPPHYHPHPKDENEEEYVYFEYNQDDDESYTSCLLSKDRPFPTSHIIPVQGFMTTKWSTFRARFVFAGTLVQILLMFALYEAVRAWIAWIYHGTTTAAFRNAEWIVLTQTDLGMGSLEYDIQTWALQYPWLITLCNHFYKQTHWSTSAIFIVYFFKYQHEYFAFIRSWFLWATLFAFLVFAFIPTAPPRLCPWLPIQDTIHLEGHYAHTAEDNPLVNHYAAMPSMHFGYSLLFSWAVLLCRFHRGGAAFGCGFSSVTMTCLLVLLCVIYPCVMCFVIQVTGNHFFFDAIGGFIVVTIAYFKSIPLLLRVVNNNNNNESLTMANRRPSTTPHLHNKIQKTTSMPHHIDPSSSSLKYTENSLHGNANTQSSVSSPSLTPQSSSSLLSNRSTSSSLSRFLYDNTNDATTTTTTVDATTLMDTPMSRAMPYLIPNYLDHIE